MGYQQVGQIIWRACLDELDGTEFGSYLSC
jgi:hypothetical protein